MKREKKELFKLPKIKELPGWRGEFEKPGLFIQPDISKPFIIKSKKEANISPRYPKIDKLPPLYIFSTRPTEEDNQEQYLLGSKVYEINLPDIRLKRHFSLSKLSKQRENLKVSGGSTPNSLSSDEADELDQKSREQSRSLSSSQLPLYRKTATPKGRNPTKRHSLEDIRKSDRNSSIKKQVKKDEIFLAENEKNEKNTEKHSRKNLGVHKPQKQKTIENKDSKIERNSVVSSLDKGQETRKKKLLKFEVTPPSDLKELEQNSVDQSNLEKPVLRSNTKNSQNKDRSLNRSEIREYLEYQSSNKSKNYWDKMIDTASPSRSSKSGFGSSRLYLSYDCDEHTFRIADEQCSEHIPMDKVNFEVFLPFPKPLNCSTFSEGLVLDRKRLLKKNSFEIAQKKNNLTTEYCLSDSSESCNDSISSLAESLPENDVFQHLASDKKIKSSPCVLKKSEDIAKKKQLNNEQYKILNINNEEEASSSSENKEISSETEENELEKNDECILKTPGEENKGNKKEKKKDKLSQKKKPAKKQNQKTAKTKTGKNKGKNPKKGQSPKNIILTPVKDSQNTSPHNEASSKNTKNNSPPNENSGKNSPVLDMKPHLLTASPSSKALQSTSAEHNLLDKTKPSAGPINTPTSLFKSNTIQFNLKRPDALNTSNSDLSSSKASESLISDSEISASSSNISQPKRKNKPKQKTKKKIKPKKQEVRKTSLKALTRKPTLIQRPVPISIMTQQKIEEQFYNIDGNEVKISIVKDIPISNIKTNSIISNTGRFISKKNTVLYSNQQSDKLSHLRNQPSLRIRHGQSKVVSPRNSSKIFDSSNKIQNSAIQEQNSVILNSLKKNSVRIFINNFSISILTMIKLLHEYSKGKKNKKKDSSQRKVSDENNESQQKSLVADLGKRLLSSFTINFSKNGSFVHMPRGSLTDKISEINTINPRPSGAKYVSTTQNYVKKSNINIPKLTSLSTIKKNNTLTSNVSSDQSESLEEELSEENSENSEESSESIELDKRLRQSALYELKNISLVKAIARSIYESQKSKSKRDSLLKEGVDRLERALEVEESRLKGEWDMIPDVSTKDLESYFQKKIFSQSIFFKDENNNATNKKIDLPTTSKDEEPDYSVNVEFKQQFLKNTKEAKQAGYTVAEYAYLQIIPTEEFITEKLNLRGNPKFKNIDQSLKASKK